MIKTVDLHKSYRRGPVEIPVLRGASIDVHAAEFLCIIGASGSGKSTLLHLMGTLDLPDRGEVQLDGRRIDNLPSRQRDQLRNRTFGLIFQFYHLLPELTAIENVMLPSMIDQSAFAWLTGRQNHRRRGEELLERVGLSHRAHHKPSEMSGGEMQRCAIARALLNSPRVLLADEPTGNLDEETGGEILTLLRDLNRNDGLTIVMVTHNLDLAASTDRIVRLTQGRVEATDSPAALRRDIRLLSEAS